MTSHQQMREGRDRDQVIADKMPLHVERQEDPIPSEILNPISSGIPDAPPDSATGIEFANGTPSTSVSTVASSTSAPTATSTSDRDGDSGGGGGGSDVGMKAGIAFGVLGGLLLIAGLVYFLITRRRKNKAAKRSSDHGEEKYGRPSPPKKDAATAKPPRVSLRPVTQFFPTDSSKRTSSKGAAMALAPTAASPNPNKPLPNGGNSPLPNPFDRPLSDVSANPFGYGAERPVSPLTDSESTVSARDPFTNDAERPVSPITEDQKSMYSERRPYSPDMAMPSARNTVGYSTTHGTRVTSTHLDIEHVDLTLPPPSRGAPSPTGTEFSMSELAPGAAVPATSSAAAIAAAGGPQNTSVHRVQLDFKPSLDDELGLRAGELVRLLHEYDDGWALCIRLDRTRQGVAPRSCLSTRPVKARSPQANQGDFPFPGRDQRPRTPNGPSFAPGVDARPESPNVWPSASGARNQGPSPMNPNGRSVSPDTRGSLPGTAL